MKLFVPAQPTNRMTKRSVLNIEKKNWGKLLKLKENKKMK